MSVIPGRSGQQRIPVRRPASRRRLTVWKRRSGPGCAGLEQAGEFGVRRCDGDVKGERVVFGDLEEKVQVAGDQGRFGDDAEMMAAAAAKGFEQAAGDAGAAFDGLIGLGGGAEGDLVGGVHFAELLLEEPGGVLFEKDEALEGEGVAQLHELVGVAGVAVFAAELAAAVGVDAPSDPAHALGGGFVEDAADFERFKFDEVTVVGVLGVGSHAGDTRGLGKDGEERGCGRVLCGWYILHLFAYKERQ